MGVKDVVQADWGLNWNEDMNSTVQYSTVQYSTVQINGCQRCMLTPHDEFLYLMLPYMIMDD